MMVGIDTIGKFIKGKVKGSSRGTQQQNDICIFNVEEYLNIWDVAYEW